MFYESRGFCIPNRMRDCVEDYIQHGQRPGAFLCAIISNDLRSACECADDENLRNIPAYVMYFYNHAPIGCWGSEDLMNKWMELRQSVDEKLGENDES